MNPAAIHDQQTPALHSSMPTVAVIGIGYVGAVSAVKLAERGCQVIGVEANPVKQQMLTDRRCPVREPGLQEAFEFVTRAGRLHTVEHPKTAIRCAQAVMVCVGTPSDSMGQSDLSAITRVCEQLADSLSHKHQPPVIMIRSTVPPGTILREIQPVLKRAHPDVVVCHHPEFLREGSALHDWEHPPMIVFGADPADRATVASLMDRLYQGIAAPVVALSLTESELIKHACNVFHAIKIDFANEIGALAEACGADPQAVMNAFCWDRQLNLSSAYLKPGFAFGGSCLPKDTRALAASGRNHSLALPLIESVMPSNETHLARQVHKIMRLGRQPTLLVGLSFKPGTDDLRESPMVELAERLLGKGVPLSIYDPDLSSEELLGTNAQFIRQHLPHLNLLLRCDLSEALKAVETVVIAKPVSTLTAANLADKTVVDLVGAMPSTSTRTAGLDLASPSPVKPGVSARVSHDRTHPVKAA